MNTEKYILPSYLLPYLFNGDASGLTAKQHTKYYIWYATNFPHGGWAISEDHLGFRQGSDFSTLGDDCHEVTFQIPDPQPEDRQESPLEDCISASDLAVIQAMRARGWAVALFTPAELEAIDSYDVEAQMIAAGNDWLQEQRST
jgi:hypothetical protein